IVEGIKHRIGLLDYLNRVELNLNAFAKIIEGRMISNDDVRSQLRSMQDLNENGVLSNLLENLENNKMDINADSFKTPTSFFVSHHLPMTICSFSDKSNLDEINEQGENNSNCNGNININKNKDIDKDSDEFNTVENPSSDEQKE
ncbi:conserved Plasmodium protein, unknown function, partial [Plasmodium malariae]